VTPSASLPSPRREPLACHERRRDEMNVHEKSAEADRQRYSGDSEHTTPIRKKRYTIELDHSVFYVKGGWLGNDCPKGEYPKPALELRFASLVRAQRVCDLLNEEWSAFERDPN
jgi:hypothetical protein